MCVCAYACACVCVWLCVCVCVKACLLTYATNVCISQVPELLRVTLGSLGSTPALRVGSAVTLTNLISTLTSLAAEGKCAY